MLQNHNCVTALQHRLSYNVAVSLPANQQSDEPAASTRRAAGPRRAGARFCRAGLVVVALLGTGVLAAACGGGPSGSGVASLGTTTTTTTGRQRHRAESTTSPAEASALALHRLHAHPWGTEHARAQHQRKGVSVHINASSGVRPELTAVHCCEQRMQAPVAERRRPQGEHDHPCRSG